MGYKSSYVLMGVSGSGKSIIGNALADELNIPFFDADDFHPNENIKKMSAGVPLTDSDRFPWLERLSQLLTEHGEKTGCVLACSALKESYRNILKKDNAHFIFLDVDKEIVIARQAARKGHFMPPSLMQSQFDALEKPVDALVVKNNGSPKETVMEILSVLS